MIFLKTEEANKRLLFCDNLRHLVRNGPVGITELSKRTGFSSKTIRGYMKGIVFPSDDKIDRLADGLGVTKYDLFDDTYAPWKFGESIEE